MVVFFTCHLAEDVASYKGVLLQTKKKMRNLSDPSCRS